MEKQISQLDLNRLTDIAYLDIIGKKNDKLEKIYKQNSKMFSLKEIFEYYLGKGDFQDGPGLPGASRPGTLMTG